MILCNGTFLLQTPLEQFHVFYSGTNFVRFSTIITLRPTCRNMMSVQMNPTFRTQIGLFQGLATCM